MAKSFKRQYEEFLQYLIDQCEMGRTVGSNIGVFWLENLCQERLASLAFTAADTIPLTQLSLPTLRGEKSLQLPLQNKEVKDLR